MKTTTNMKKTSNTKTTSNKNTTSNIKMTLNKPNLSNQTYQTKTAKPNLWEKILSYQTNATKATKWRHQNWIHEPNWQIQSMLVNQSKQGSSQNQTSLRLPWAWHSWVPACCKVFITMKFPLVNLERLDFVYVNCFNLLVDFNQLKTLLSWWVGNENCVSNSFSRAIKDMDSKDCDLCLLSWASNFY